MAASKQKIITKKSLADDLSAKFDINRFGKFSRVKKKARTARNPHTGEEIKVKASYAPKFKPSKTLKEQVK